MLSLRSYRDFPEVFSDGAAERYLTADERTSYGRMADGEERRRWLLSRLTVKELCQRYFEEEGVRQVGADLIGLSEGDQRQPSLVIDGLVPGGPELPAVNVASCGRYAVACVRESSLEDAFGLGLAPVVLRYPFIDEAEFTHAECEALRQRDSTEVDTALAGIRCLKETAQRTMRDELNSAPPPLEVVGLHTGGRAEVRLLGAGISNAPVLRARVWVFDHHVFVFVALWRDPADAPHDLVQVEEAPALPSDRHCSTTL